MTALKIGLLPPSKQSFIKEKYERHELSSEATPVPQKNINKGWKNDENEKVNRSGASKTDLCPNEQRGSLEYNLLRKFGFIKKLSVEGNALCFQQFIRPMYNQKSWV